MEFPGGSITNIRVIDGFSNIYWRIYTEETGGSNAPGDSSNNAQAILKHISRLKELELRLRSQGCLVLSYPRRLGLLIFSATPDFDHLAPLFPSERKDDSNRLVVGNSVLKVWTSGSVSSVDLAKSLRSDLQTTSVNSPAASQRLQSGSVPPRRVDNSGGSAAIYASFISAVTAALSLQIVRQNNAIPLGPRTLFNTVEVDLDEGHGIVNNGPSSISALTSLQIQLTSVGKLTVALQTIAQPGLTRLGQPGARPSDFSHVPPWTDLWLAPSGSIARLVTVRPENNNSSRFASASGDTRSWKSNVLEWLGYFGLPVDHVSQDGWVEVEVWEPFYSKMFAAAARFRDENSSLPLKRILWPAVYCFRRTKSSPPDTAESMEELLPFLGDPLEFAETWCSIEIPSVVETNVKPPSEVQAKQTSQQETLSPGFTSVPEGVESLSRASQYPDLNNASLVYPTPPDGTAGIGVNPTVSTDVFTEDPDLSSSLVQGHLKPKHNFHSMTNNRSESDITMMIGPASGLGVGSGLYDTNEDDDLFGDINERDFGTKGITDADFSFFDDHDFDHPRNGHTVVNIQESPEFVDTSKPNAVVETSESEVPSPDESIEKHYDPPASPERRSEDPREQSAPEINARISSPHDSQVQTISPPLSPVEVKKILFPESSTSSQTLARERQPSYYSPITFKNNISWDKKYGADGKYSFIGAGAALAEGSNTPSGGIPIIGPPRRKSSVKIFGHSKTTNGLGSHPNETQESSSSPDSSSEIDDESGDSDLEDLPSASLVNLKRKRARSSPRESPVPASEKGLVGAQQESSTSRSEDSTFLGNFLSTFSDWSITGFFSLPENQIFPSLAARDVQIHIAQLLVDQVTQSSLDHRLDEKLRVSCLDNQAFSLRELLEGSEFLGGFEKLDLSSFMTLQEQNPHSPEPLNAPRHQSHRRETGKGSISKLTPPHLRVRRGNDFLETLPPAISFWETFGLEPAHGPKDITAYCIHSHVATTAADAFLERLGLLYSSCNFGRHSRGNDSDDFDNGLCEWTVQPSKQSEYHNSMQQLRAICEELGTALLNGAQSGDNIVVYIIDPFSHVASLVDICAAFWCLLQKYVTSADKQQAKQLDQVLLQIIPLNFVTSAESLVVPPQAEYLKLAMEVYSRCSLRLIQQSLLNSAPPVMLAEPLPRSIGFRLASDRASPLLEGKCLHVACSRSQDQRWLSVAWSDNHGILQQTISYCLRFRNSTASRTISAVRGEIWVATKDILDRNQARWRVIIVSTENVDQDEYDMWLNLTEQYNKSRTIPVELAMLNVNTTSDLFLSAPPALLQMSVLNQQATSTPIATPLPSATILSPEQLGNAPTPPNAANAPANASTPTDALLESESETQLTDICDESWAVVLSHRLNGTLHLTEYRPALASGYLLRRKGPTDANGAFALTVNLLYTQRPSSSNETLLRDIIGMYRDLATLARARGTRIVQSSTLPWHIATALRAQEVLSYVL